MKNSAIDRTSEIFSADQVRAALRPDSRYFPRSRVVSVEQTTNMGGGRVWPLEAIRSVRGGRAFIYLLGWICVDDFDMIAQAYKTGRGSFRLRASISVEKEKGGGWHLLVSEIPYGVQKGKLIEQIAALIGDKKLPILADVKDESDEKVRLVLEPRARTVDPDLLLESLYRLTDLEIRFPLNLNVLDQHRTPGVMGLKSCLTAWLSFQIEVLLNRSRTRVGKIEDRLELLDGFLIAFLNLDRVIEIIRGEDEPKPVLMAEFSLSDRQAEAILNMRLRSLRKLEEMEISRERDALLKERDELAKLIDELFSL